MIGNGIRISRTVAGSGEDMGLYWGWVRVTFIFMIKVKVKVKFGG